MVRTRWRNVTRRYSTWRGTAVACATFHKYAHEYNIYGILTVYTIYDILLGSLAVAEERVQLVAAPTR